MATIGRKKRILIVDDEPDIPFALKKILEENGFRRASRHL
jgi:DNA-binding response OmpR family regulator